MSSDKAVWALVVANDAHTLVIVTDFLKELNIHYKRNTTGVGVPQQARALQPALILLDLDLADHDPFAIIKAIQVTSELTDTPILAIGNPSWEATPALTTAKLAGFVAKPLPRHQFRQAVQTALNLPPNSGM
ncbi:MAG: hypothetical protein K8L97_14195 [Anaerolineae bacterium]|nr:hypothetical protein [Anaerolineae bacterium]